MRARIPDPYHAGFAIQELTEEEARETFEMVEQVLGQVREQLSTFPGEIQSANEPVRFFRPVTDEYIQSFPSR